MSETNSVYEEVIKEDEFFSFSIYTTKNSRSEIIQ